MKRYFLPLVFLASGGMQGFSCSFAQSLENVKYEDPTFEVAFAAPRSFGRTHFIVGHPGPEHVESTRKNEPAASTIQVFFSPDDDVRKELIALIDREEKAIRIAVYFMTEPEIAKALQRSKKREVKVELITDVGCLKERSNKVSMLCDSGCKLFIYNPPSTNRGSSLMHHKFALFSSNNGRSLLWTGSYNFTRAASTSNQENAILVDNKKMFDQFAYQFKRLKARSYRYGKTANDVKKHGT